MEHLFDINDFNKYREDNRREVKKAKDSLPNSLWETYSAFANCYGGVIILGVKENSDGSWYTTGLKDSNKMKKQFWDIINNTQKVNINLLNENDVVTYNYNDDVIMVINVPAAKREQKPVYINNDLFGGCYRRNFEGDYHCTRLQVKTMLRDQSDDTVDMITIDNIEIDILNNDTITSYRNYFASLNPSHPFLRMNKDEFLRCIGAAAISYYDKRLHPTAAGLLMFGNDYDITRQFPEYFLDYRNEIDSESRWSDRFQSSSGDWSGNIFDFYYRVYNKLKQNLKIPFVFKNGNRVDDTPIHEALREVIVNCLTNADYYGSRGIVITLHSNRITFANPGYCRIGKEQMKLGGISDPRNKSLMKMFNLIEIGERAGSGIPKVFNICNDENLKEPIIDEQFEPDRTIITLSLEKKQAIKCLDASKKSSKTLQYENMILNYLKDNGRTTCAEIAKYIGLSASRTRVILTQMKEIESIGDNKNRTYRLK